MFEYVKKIQQQIDLIAQSQETALSAGAEWLSEAILKDKIIHTFGTGHSHMIGLELAIRAGGLANVNAILDSAVLSVEGARRGAMIERLSGLADILWDAYTFEKEDVMIVVSNSGRNALPIEMAQKARDFGMKTIGITSLQQSKQYPSRHPSGKKLYQLVDLVIDNCVPSGDVMMEIAGNRIGPASSISGMLIINTMSTEAMKIASQKGGRLPIYFSQNIDGFSNEELYDRYEDRIKHL
ncbi:MAG: SIS domain-containing protein [Bacteroidota bacterium]